MIVRIYLKSGNVIELPHMENIKATKDTASQEFTALEWTYAVPEDRGPSDARLVSVSLSQIEAVTTADD